MRTARRATGRTVALAAAGVAVVLVVVAVSGIDLNPFGTETKDRSQPVLMRSLESLSEYRAATANMQEIVDIEKDVKFVPDFIAGSKALLVAAGSADAGVDFRGLDRRAIRVSGNRSAVTITLPPPRVIETRVDLAKSRIVDTDRGAVNRIGDAFSDDTNEERQLLLLAQHKIDAAAKQNPELLALAQRNTRAMLTGMLQGLGFERIAIRFAQPPA
jgi:hypothetical protein